MLYFSIPVIKYSLNKSCDWCHKWDSSFPPCLLLNLLQQAGGKHTLTTDIKYRKQIPPSFNFWKCKDYSSPWIRTKQLCSVVMEKQQGNNLQDFKETEYFLHRLTKHLFDTHNKLKSSLWLSSPFPSDTMLSSLSISSASTWRYERPGTGTFCDKELCGPYGWGTHSGFYNKYILY